MPNPFPGMDPYLEGPLWSSVQFSLVQQIGWQLAPKLRPRYFVFTNERLFRAAPDPIEWPGPQLPVESLSQSFLEIASTDARDVVTVIEVLTPTNKRGSALENFRRTRQERLAGTVHYLEIDLLRIGERFTVTEALPDASYFVFLSRANRRPNAEVWAMTLEQHLPFVPIPLGDGERDETLDLQLALNTIYEQYSYERATRHSGQPVVPLSQEQLTWADQCMQKAGLKS